MTTSPITEIAEFGTAEPARLLTRMLHAYQWLASREILACTAVLALTLGIRGALLPWMAIPQPVIHDEFSYLLAADTYAHGRLTNPPHPFWQHFETFQELQQPTYASKYQPLQGLVLAFGQKLFGEPWIGVYLSTGLLCAAICWMLQGWIAPNWALLGAFFCVLRVGVFSYWMNSYLAGSVPGIGGALALGAAVRIWRRKQFGHSVTWALGLSILALSRPYDAAVLGVVTTALLLWLLRRSQTPLATIGVRVALPALMVLLLCVVGIGYNDYRVTGNAMTLPYQVHDGQYAMAAMFTMMPPRPEPIYRHPVIRKFWAEWNVGQWTDSRNSPVMLSAIKLYSFDDFFFPLWFLSIPVLLWPYPLATAEERVTVFLLAVFLLMIAPLIAAQPHYGAAFAGVFYLRYFHGLTRLWSWQAWGKPTGRILGIMLVTLMVADGFHATSGRDMFSAGFALRGSQLGAARHAVQQSFAKQPGRHLVLVRYKPEHDPQNEWVYNEANIDASPVVWAREMGPEQDRPFLQYFRDRKVWLLEPDVSTQLVPYPR